MKKFILSLGLLFTQITLQAMEISLHEAAKSGNVDQIQELIKNHADTNAYDEYGYTPLHYAIIHGEKECVEELLKAGTNPNIANKQGDTPLHCAAKYSNPKYVKLLITNDNKNAVNSFGCTPLHGAVLAPFYNHPVWLKQLFVIGDTIQKCVEELLKAEVNPLIKMTSGACAGKTALEIVTQVTTMTSIQSASLKEKYQNIKNLLQNYENNWRRIQTFLMASHERLGQHSPAHVLPKPLYRKIFKHLL